MTMQQITVLVPLPNCAMHIKLDKRGTFQRARDGRGGKKSRKRRLEQREGGTEVDYEDKGYVTVVKPLQVSLL